MEIESKSERECTKKERTAGWGKGGGRKKGKHGNETVVFRRKRNYKEAKARATRTLNGCRNHSLLSYTRGLVSFFLAFPCSHRCFFVGFASSTP